MSPHYRAFLMNRIKQSLNSYSPILSIFAVYIISLFYFDKYYTVLSMSTAILMYLVLLLKIKKEMILKNRTEMMLLPLTKPELFFYVYIDKAINYLVYSVNFLIFIFGILSIKTKTLLPSGFAISMILMMIAYLTFLSTLFTLKHPFNKKKNAQKFWEALRMFSFMIANIFLVPMTFLLLEFNGTLAVLSLFLMLLFILIVFLKKQDMFFYKEQVYFKKLRFNYFLDIPCLLLCLAIAYGWISYDETKQPNTKITMSK